MGDYDGMGCKSGGLGIGFPPRSEIIFFGSCGLTCVVGEGGQEGGRGGRSEKKLREKKGALGSQSSFFYLTISPPPPPPLSLP